MVSEYVTQNDSGVYTLTLAPCTCSVLQFLFRREYKYTWIWQHMPLRDSRWQEEAIPLFHGEPPSHVRVRDVVFDLEMATGDFLEVLPKFEAFGCVAYQLTRPVPDTLKLELIEPSQHTRVLLHNGVCTSFYLPFPHEAAVFWARHVADVEKALTYPEVVRLAIRREV